MNEELEATARSDAPWHSDVALTDGGEMRLHWTSPPVPGAIADARHRAENVLREWGLAGETVEVVVLIVSELVTNAHRHARTEARVELVRRADSVVLRVSDGSSAHPEVQPLDPARPGGHGMHLVSRVTHRWGVNDRPRGKQVWAVFDI